MWWSSGWLSSWRNHRIRYRRRSAPRPPRRAPTTARCSCGREVCRGRSPAPGRRARPAAGAARVPGRSVRVRSCSPLCDLCLAVFRVSAGWELMVRSTMWVDPRSLGRAGLRRLDPTGAGGVRGADVAAEVGRRTPGAFVLVPGEVGYEGSRVCCCRGLHAVRRNALAAPRRLLGVPAPSVGSAGSAGSGPEKRCSWRSASASPVPDRPRVTLFRVACVAARHRHRGATARKGCHW